MHGNKGKEEVSHTMHLRKHSTASLRIQVIKELEKGEKPLVQIAFEYGVRPNQLLKWKRMTLENLPGLSLDYTREGI